MSDDAPIEAIGSTPDEACFNLMCSLWFKAHPKLPQPPLFDDTWGACQKWAPYTGVEHKEPDGTMWFFGKDGKKVMLNVVFHNGVEWEAQALVV